MSKFTTEVRFICESYAGLDESTGSDNIETVLENCVDRIFNFNFPIYDESHRRELEKKILMHYYTREICEETVGLWKLRLMQRLNDIMPYYNELYRSNDFEYNPLHDTDYTKEYEGDGKTTNSGADVTTKNFETNTTNSGADVVNSARDANSTDGGSDSSSYTKGDKNSRWDLYSDTPQGGINGIQYAEDEPALSTNAYLTNARHIIDDGTGSSGNNTNTYGKTNTVDEDIESTTIYGKKEKQDGDETGKVQYGKIQNDERNYTEKVSGKVGGASYQELIKQFRDNIVNIDLKIIKELSDLFFGLWE